jgi:hypothetical protein
VPLQPNIGAFYLATFTSLVGGRTAPDRVTAVVDDVAARLAAAQDEDVRPVLEFVRRILTGALVPGSVEKETSSLVNAVIALATTGQRPLWLDVVPSRHGFIDFASRFPPSPADLAGGAGDGPTMQTLIRWALLQRPLFGRPQGSWWSTYGYLSNSEVGRLLEYHHRHPTLGAHDPEFGANFFARLEDIHEAGLDYWFHCS